MTDPVLLIPAGIVGAAASIVAVREIWKRAIRPILRAIRRAVHLVDVAEEILPHVQSLPDALPVLVEIADEFRPNHGASLKDQISRVEEHVTASTLRFDAIEDALSANRATLRRLAAVCPALNGSAEPTSAPE